MNLQAFQEQIKTRVNDQFRAYLGQLPTTNDLLRESLLYSTLDGGKRLRPFLVYTVGLLKEIPLSTLDSIATAIEMIHCYSLVHDDLPAMDNAPLRRGKKSCHAAFGEATGILAGDALLTFAFEMIAHAKALNDAQKVRMIAVLAQASGPVGMVDGQAMDMAAEGRSLTLEQLTLLHRKKTGALIEAAVALGYLSWNAVSETEKKALDGYSQKIGLAFQVQDDILDETSDVITLGKPTGADDTAHKNTFVRLLGLENAKAFCQTLIEEAKVELLKTFEKSDVLYLIELADFIFQRNN